MSTVRAKLSKKFDYIHASRAHSSYPAGYDGPMPQAHFDAAKAAGAVGGEAAFDPAQASAAELEKAFDKNELVAMAEKAGIEDVSGTKAELAERIVAARK